MIEVEYWNLLPDVHLHVTLHLFTEQGIIAFTTGSGLTPDPVWPGCPPEGLFRSVCHVPGNLLNSGMHRVKVMIVRDSRFAGFTYEDAVAFEVVDVAERGYAWYGKEPGVVQPRLKWTTEYIDGRPVRSPTEFVR